MNLLAVQKGRPSGLFCVTAGVKGIVFLKNMVISERFAHHSTGCYRKIAYPRLLNHPSYCKLVAGLAIGKRKSEIMTDYFKVRIL